jgi:hypothetical protein
VGHSPLESGSSLAESQDRTLHLEAVCWGTPDGLWRVEHRIYNPRGTVFREEGSRVTRKGGARRTR